MGQTRKSPRYKAGTGRPRMERGRIRHLNLAIDEHLYLALAHVSNVTKKPKWRLVEMGIRMVFNKLKETWPIEWLTPPEDHELPEDFGKDE